MRINSNYTDFYDYVIGLVGVDTDRYFYRVTKEVEVSGHDDNLKIKNLILGHFNTIRIKKPRGSEIFYNPFISDNIAKAAETFISKCGIGVSLNTGHVVFGTKVVNVLVLTRKHNTDGATSETYTPILSINRLKGILSDKSIFNISSSLEGNEEYKKLINKIDKIKDTIIERELDINGLAVLGSVQDMQLDNKSMNHLVEYNKMVGSPISLLIQYAKRQKDMNKAWTVIANPMLVGSGIESVCDPIETYQNIEMSIISINNTETEVIFSNDVMVESKGFDKKISFRNRKK